MAELICIVYIHNINNSHLYCITTKTSNQNSIVTLEMGQRAETANGICSSRLDKNDETNFCDELKTIIPEK